MALTETNLALHSIILYLLMNLPKPSANVIKGQIVELLWNATFETSATVIFSLTLICLFVVLFLNLLITKKKSLVAVGPSLLATIGVIGTFFGIFIGLQDFDVNNIDSSVPTLLNGLKTAFVTSLLGMSLSVVLRFITALTPQNTTSTQSAVDVLNDITRRMSEMQADSSKHHEAMMHEMVESIAKPIFSEISQLRRDTRTSNEILKEFLEQSKAQHKEHMEEFRSFANHMVENTHQELIKALETVIKDFNQQLTTQFGENFKQLNVAVGRMIEWQENYKTHVESMEEQAKRSMDAIESCEQSIKEIQNSAQTIPNAIQPLSSTLNNIETALSQLTDELSAYADMKDKAVSAFPIINENLDNLTNKLTDYVDRTVKNNDLSIEKQQNSLNTLTDSLEKGINETKQMLHKEVQDLDKSLNDELSRALKMMSDNLGSMSKKFVDDYDPLTRQLAGLINMSRNAENGNFKRTG